MDSHNCLTPSCRALISTLFFYCWPCRQERAAIAAERARMSKEARKLPTPSQAMAGDSLGYWRPF
jgi:hypothetical protein